MRRSEIGVRLSLRYAATAVSAERCTALYGVPTMFVAMIDHPDFRRHDYTSLGTDVMAGAPCPVEVMRQVIGSLHMPQVTIGCGMTETSPISFQGGIDDNFDDRVSTVERIHPHVEVKIVDTAVLMRDTMVEELGS